MYLKMAREQGGGWFVSPQDSWRRPTVRYLCSCFSHQCFRGVPTVTQTHSTRIANVRLKPLAKWMCENKLWMFRKSPYVCGNAPLSWYSCSLLLETWVCCVGYTVGVQYGIYCGNTEKKDIFGDSKYYNLKTKLKMKILRVRRNIHIHAFHFIYLISPGLFGAGGVGIERWKKRRCRENSFKVFELW